MINETSDYTIIILRTNDSSIIGIIVIPKKNITLNYEITWETIKNELTKKQSQIQSFKEVWIPGFKVDSTIDTKLSLMITETKGIKRIIEIGRLEVFSGEIGEGQLILDNTNEVFIVEDDFIFGINLYKNRIDT